MTPRQKEINTAVDRGVAYLDKRLAEGGKFYAVGDPAGGAHPGAVALLGLTLLECGAASNGRLTCWTRWANWNRPRIRSRSSSLF